MSVRTPPPSGQFVLANRRKVHYCQWGSGPDLILLHGASGNLRDWSFGIAQHLAPHFRVTAFDRPGLGHSERIRRAGNPEVQANHLRLAAAELGIDQAIVMGHSYGGPVAMAWALNAPETVRALFLLGAPSQLWEGGVGRIHEILALPLIGWFASHLLPIFASDQLVEGTLKSIFVPQPIPQSYAAHVQPELTLQPQVSRENARQLTTLKQYMPNLIKRYYTLSVPFVMLHGTADSVVPMSIHSTPTSETVEGSRLVEFPGIGHMPHHFCEAEILAALKDVAT